MSFAVLAALLFAPTPADDEAAPPVPVDELPGVKKEGHLHE